MDLNTIITGFHELTFGAKIAIWVGTLFIVWFAGFMTGRKKGS